MGYRFGFNNLTYLQKLKKDTAVFSRETGYVVGSTRMVIEKPKSLGYHMLSHAKVCDDQVWVEITTRNGDII